MKKVTLLVFMLGMIGCENTPQKVAENPKENLRIIKTYEVPIEYGKQISSALNRLLKSKSLKEYLQTKEGTVEKVVDVQAEFGRSYLATPTVLTVSAPVSLQNGIPDIIKKIVKSKTTSHVQIKLDLWLVVAVPVKKSLVSVDKEIEGALKPFIEKNINHCIVELEHLSTLTTTGEKLVLRGGNLSLNSTTILFKNKYLADIKLRGKSKVRLSVKSRINIDKTTPLVIAEIGQKQNRLSSFPQNILQKCNLEKDNSIPLKSNKLSAKTIVVIKMSPEN